MYQYKPKPKCFRAIINFPKQNSDLAHQNTKQLLKYSALGILVFISIFCGLLAGARVFFRARVWSRKSKFSPGQKYFYKIFAKLKSLLSTYILDLQLLRKSPVENLQKVVKKLALPTFPPSLKKHLHRTAPARSIVT